MNFFIVLRKELMEQWRVSRLLIVAVVLVVFGLASPLLAKVTPDLLKAIPDVPPELISIFPTPTLADAVVQYVKNMYQFGILLALLMSMGSIAQEKERGTAAMILTHPVSRLVFLLAKFIALGITFAVSLALASLACWYYTLLLFGALPWGAYLALNGLMLLAFLVYVALALLCSTLVRTQGAAAGLTFAALVLFAGFGAIPRINEFMPGRLFDWGQALVLGGGEPAWSAFWVSLGVIAGALCIAWLVFRRQEL